MVSGISPDLRSGNTGLALGGHQTFTLIATPGIVANTDDNIASPKTGIAFRAYTIVASNPTGQWYYLPAANSYVPPYTTQMVIPVLSGTESAEAVAQTPGTFTSVPLALQVATFTFCADILPPQSGYAVSGFTAPFSTVWQGPLTNRSGVVAAGPASTLVAAANLARRFLRVTNPLVADGGAGVTLWIDYGVAAVAASPSEPIPVGGNVTFEGQMIPTDAINVFSTVAGAVFIAKEG